MQQLAAGSHRFTFQSHAITRDVTRIWLGGEISRADAEALDALLHAVEAVAAVLILDVRAVTAIDPAVPEVIRAADRRASRYGRRLVVVRRNGWLGSALDELSLDARMLTVDTPARARLELSETLEWSDAAAGQADRAVIAASGVIDIATGPELATALACQAGMGRSILLDLRGVEFMDSTGVCLLIQANERAREDALGFELIGSAPVDRTLGVAGLRGHFGMSDPLART